ncbi:MAG: cell division protein DivIVA [Firmicutes bacterium HGW-Firmicutes-7]|nr:MAG: cell division protein DivIVA [Firmicutes bacterium HGW-Firmicutes-7]
MLTPLDIESKVFSKSFQGYNTNEVKTFIKEVLTYYEKFYKENIELKDKLNTLQEAVQYYKNIETTLQNTLILAEKTAEETKTSARYRAEQIEKEAQLKADVMINDARNEIISINNIKEELIRNFDHSKIQIKQYLKTQLEITEKSDIDFDFGSSAFDMLFRTNTTHSQTEIEAPLRELEEAKLQAAPIVDDGATRTFQLKTPIPPFNEDKKSD